MDTGLGGEKVSGQRRLLLAAIILPIRAHFFTVSDCKGTTELEPSPVPCSEQNFPLSNLCNRLPQAVIHMVTDKHPDSILRNTHRPKHHYALVILEIDNVPTDNCSVCKNQEVKNIDAICCKPLCEQAEEKTETQSQPDRDLAVENMVRHQSNGDLEEYHDETEGNSRAGTKKDGRSVDLQRDVCRSLFLADE